MTSLPITRNAPRSVYSADRAGAPSAAGWLRAVMSDRTLIILTSLCLIGLLVSLNLIFRFPAFPPGIEEIAQILG
jgi:hypothetical protein